MSEDNAEKIDHLAESLNVINGMVEGSTGELKCAFQKEARYNRLQLVMFCRALDESEVR